jgi:uncharacterized protein YbjT (DUF2867 family)
MRSAYVVVGATGHVGKVVAERLKAHGQEVRPIGRRAGVDFEDAGALRRAFTGADGAFLMIPFDRHARDLHRKENAVGEILAGAVTEARVRRVVFFSGTSASLREGAGSGLGAARMEGRLDRLSVPELVHLRGCFLMENFLPGVGAIARTGRFAWAFRPDLPTSMIAAKDVGKIAALLLTEESFRQPRVRELLGPSDYTMAEAVRILGASIGRPEARYVQASYEDARAAMIGAGLSASFADAVMETARGFNEGKVWAKERRSDRNTTETSLEEFAEEVFAEAYRDATRSVAGSGRIS